MFSETAKGLQCCFDKLEQNCYKLNLSDFVNVMIFNKAGRSIRNLIFHYGGSDDISITGKYKYLGVLFKPYRLFSHDINFYVTKRRKQCFVLESYLFQSVLMSYNTKNYLKHVYNPFYCIVVN